MPWLGLVRLGGRFDLDDAAPGAIVGPCAGRARRDDARAGGPGPVSESADDARRGPHARGTGERAGLRGREP
ncbi:MAG TPA: hypothetical protein DD670_14270 [Planctomycetaceae bacterium]|nr:hypothetical protein [Planctomycetaceae bacterium]